MDASMPGESGLVRDESDHYSTNSMWFRLQKWLCNNLVQIGPILDPEEAPLLK